MLYIIGLGIGAAVGYQRAQVRGAVIGGVAGFFVALVAFVALVFFGGQISPV